MPLIQAGSVPSGLDIYTRFGGVLTDPSGITFDIFDPSGTKLAPSGVSGFKQTVGHHDARNFGAVPSGALTGWLITWTVISPVGVTTSHSESFEVATALDAGFTNVDNFYDQVKLDLAIDDTLFTDAQMDIFMVKSLNRLNRNLSLTGTDYELSLDQTTSSVLPTPDSSVHDLIILQMECLISKNIRRNSVGKGIKVRDGDSEIDTTASFGGHNQVVLDACSELSDAVAKYLFNDPNSSSNPALHGGLITYDNSFTITDVDHAGDSAGTRDYSSPFDSSSGPQDLC